MPKFRYEPKERHRITLRVMAWYRRELRSQGKTWTMLDLVMFAEAFVRILEKQTDALLNGDSDIGSPVGLLNSTGLTESRESA